MVRVFSLLKESTLFFCCVKGKLLILYGKDDTRTPRIFKTLKLRLQSDLDSADKSPLPKLS